MSQRIKRRTPRRRLSPLDAALKVIEAEIAGPHAITRDLALFVEHYYDQRGALMQLAGWRAHVNAAREAQERGAPCPECGYRELR